MNVKTQNFLIDWEKAYELYNLYRVKENIFELYPLTMEQFHERYQNHLLPFFDSKDTKGFIFYTKEGKTVVIRFIMTPGELDLNAWEKAIRFIENSFSDFEKILYFSPSQNNDMNSFFKNHDFILGLRRPRLLASVKDLLNNHSLSSEFKIRKYKAPEDRKNFADIMNLTFKDVWNHETITIERVAAWDQERSFDPEGYLFLLHRERIIGFLAVSVETETSEKGKVCVLHEIGIIPEYRKQNLASFLLSRAASFAQKKGAQVIFLTVDEKNENALRFYRKQGFEKIYEMNTYFKKAS